MESELYGSVQLVLTKLEVDPREISQGTGCKGKRMVFPGRGSTQNKSHMILNRCEREFVCEPPMN